MASWAALGNNAPIVDGSRARPAMRSVAGGDAWAFGGLRAFVATCDASGRPPSSIWTSAVGGAAMDRDQKSPTFGGALAC
jgi:hypothetical protein